MKLTTRRQGHVAWILPALLACVFFIAGCGNARDNGVMAQPLTLPTPASSSASGTGGIILPEQIVVVVVTPTAAQDAASQQSQAVAQAQPTALPEGGQAQEGQARDQELISMGESIYMANCAACHQPNGEGISNYPPLAGSPIVTADDPTAAIETVVNGRGQMPAFGGSLSAEEIAAVLSYVRNSWGNSASVVTPEQVSQIQGGGAQAGGAAGAEQATPAAGAQVTPTAGAQITPTAGAEVTSTAEAQVTPTVEAQATPTPETGSTDQAAGTAQVQVAPMDTGTQISVTQEQTGNVITIRIEIVILTPEAAALAQPTAPATPAGEAAATPAQPTPVSQGESSGGAAPSPAAQEEQGDATGEAQSADQELLATGEYLYGTNCANCHQLSGEGNTAYPSLVNSELVIAEDPTAAILTILNGRGHMPAFAGLLSDQEIAAVLSHERNAWGNSASIVTAEQVAQLRGDGSAQPAATPAPQSGVAPDVASRASEAPLSGAQFDAQEVVTVPAISGEQAALYVEQILERPEVAAVISYVRDFWNKNVSLATNAQVQ